jgi:hypothetical protein
MVMTTLDGIADLFRVLSRVHPLITGSVTAIHSRSLATSVKPFLIRQTALERALHVALEMVAIMIWPFVSFRYSPTPFERCTKQIENVSVSLVVDSIWFVLQYLNVKHRWLPFLLLGIFCVLNPDQRKVTRITKNTAPWQLRLDMIATAQKQSLSADRARNGSPRLGFEPVVRSNHSTFHSRNHCAKGP